ncbi:hypothetical protein AX774_g2112 [Zancudomyces culisetae]|uniref:Uncharacterized protein n=1 Tax=Zancudomyces culisetae TaxID=1213189 RepID=A0A1R1PTN7_ZANCU|nr:hypothetical protein AX774_g2112 [Zancudomyces culisetae]|eukprot:OMH84356.1 hypothetical protein AX774_g2112 [Zancudomyces culisetae]
MLNNHIKYLEEKESLGGEEDRSNFRLRRIYEYLEEHEALLNYINSPEFNPHDGDVVLECISEDCYPSCVTVNGFQSSDKESLKSKKIKGKILDANNLELAYSETENIEENLAVQNAERNEKNKLHKKNKTDTTDRTKKECNPKKKAASNDQDAVSSKQDVKRFSRLTIGKPSGSANGRDVPFSSKEEVEIVNKCKENKVCNDNAMYLELEEKRNFGTCGIIESKLKLENVCTLKTLREADMNNVTIDTQCMQTSFFYPFPEPGEADPYGDKKHLEYHGKYHEFCQEFGKDVFLGYCSEPEGWKMNYAHWNIGMTGHSIQERGAHISAENMLLSRAYPSVGNNNGFWKPRRMD